MTIALCDDDADFRAQTERCLVQTLETRRLTAQIRAYSDAAELLAARVAGTAFDFYLLDIIMPGMDGMALAHKIRETQPLAPILFFTTSEDYALEAFAVGAAHYVVKPFELSKFEEALDRALALLPRASSAPLLIKTARGVETVAAEEIVSAETAGHLLCVTLRDGRQLHTRMTGQELWQKLEPTASFVRVGAAVTLNLDWVRAVEAGRAVLRDGTVFLVPRRVQPEVRTAFMKYRCR